VSLTVGSLFSGIGGIDLGLERAGMRVIWHSEIDPYACRVLRRHWPDVPNLGDITDIDWSTVERPDIICGGYPCPAFSQAARGRNVAPDLWPHMRGCIEALRPRYAILENVAAHLGRGFAGVLADLDALGFDAEWSVVTACSLGAPHVRRRLFVVAHADGGSQPGSAIDAQAPFLRHVATPAIGWPQHPAGTVGMANGIPDGMDRHRLRALGNAVVPQIAEHIGRMILEAAA
jgi:DNA (cytosine-5)-methyltransferase 1